MTHALLPLWILVAPLVLILADRVLAPMTTSTMPVQSGATYLQSPSVVTP